VKIINEDMHKIRERKGKWREARKSCLPSTHRKLRKLRAGFVIL